MPVYSTLEAHWAHLFLKYKQVYCFNSESMQDKIMST